MNSTLKIGLCAFALTAASLASAGELGRLFFTPAERTQLDHNYAREARPDSGNGVSAHSLTLNGIVQRHGGKRTAWINGVPQTVGSSDDKAPDSMPISLPGQNKSVKLKVGQHVLLGPSTRPGTLTPSLPKPDTAKKNSAADDD